MNMLLNNEALGLLVLQSFINRVGSVDLSRIFLVLPIVFDRKICMYLKNKNTKILSSKELVVAKSELFYGFNEKFYDSLVVTTNSLIMGLELGVLKMEKGVVSCNSCMVVDKGELGLSLNNMMLAIPNVAKLMREPSDELFFNMRVEL